MMTKEEFAKLLDGREYGEEMTEVEETLAAKSWLVVIFGYSDDNAELRGTINDEVSCYEGGTFYVNDSGVVRSECDCDNCPYFIREQKKGVKIDALWNSDGYSWTYAASVPYATFRILEDGDKYCRGIVFSFDDQP